MANPLKDLPSVKQIQDHAIYEKYRETYGVADIYLTKLAKQAVQAERTRLKNNEMWENPIHKDILLKNIFKRMDEALQRLSTPAAIKVINATGIVLHTNLGRARIGENAARQVTASAANYSDLEYNLETGARGSRYERVEMLLTLITGAEAAVVVNNNAAAVFLVLRALAKERDVLVSRGELVEIGGSFRVSSIAAESGAHLVEVGTTNKTHPQDYFEAITERAAMILKVHRSNFTMSGFTSEVSRRELATISQNKQLIFYEDLGSGAFYDYQRYGIGEEPLISELLTEGVDIVSASGDKLFGGPQAGIILGKKSLIETIKRHQMMRALRVDKMTLAALTATLQAYLSPEVLKENVPAVRDILADPLEIAKRAQRLLDKLNAYKDLSVETVNTEARVGGGTMPEVMLKSAGVAVTHQTMSVSALAKALRTGRTAIVGRVAQDRLILDCRTITDDEIDDVVRAFQEILRS